MNDIGPVEEDCYLVTLDVSSLYTNIVLQAEYLFSSRPQPDFLPSNESILLSMKLVPT